MVAVSKKGLCALDALLVLFMISSISVNAIPEYYMEERCINNNIINLATETHEAVRLRLTRNPAYTRNINCVMVIQPPPGKKLIVRFNELDIQQLQTGQCLDALVAIDGQDQASARLLQGTPQQICGQSRPAQAYVTQQGPLLLRFASGQTNVARKGFDLLITAYKDGPCASNEYTCNNQRCINENLRCSGLDHCGDGTRPCLLTAEAVAGIAVGGALLLIIIIAVIVFCVCRHKRKTNFSEKAHAHDNRRNGYEPTVVQGESIKINGNNVRGVVY